MPSNVYQLSTSTASGGSDVNPTWSAGQAVNIISTIDTNDNLFIADGTTGIGKEYTGAGIYQPWWRDYYRYYDPRPYPYYAPVVIDNTAVLQQEISALRKQIEELEASVKKEQASAREAAGEQKSSLLSGVLDLLDTATTDEQRSKILEMARRILSI